MLVISHCKHCTAWQACEVDSIFTLIKCADTQLSFCTRNRVKKTYLLYPKPQLVAPTATQHPVPQAGMTVSNKAKRTVHPRRNVAATLQQFCFLSSSSNIFP